MAIGADVPLEGGGAGSLFLLLPVFRFSLFYLPMLLSATSSLLFRIPFPLIRFLFLPHHLIFSVFSHLRLRITAECIHKCSCSSLLP